MSSWWISLFGFLFGAWHIAQGLRGKRDGHVELGALDGYASRGKWLSWRIRVATGAIVVGLALVAMALSFAGHPPGTAPFAIAKPAGWIDLSEETSWSNAARLGLDERALRDRAKGTVAFAGVVDDGRLTSFEARIAQGAWSATLDRLRESAAGNTEGIEQLTGTKPTLSDFELLDVQGVRSGRYKTTLNFGGKTFYSLTYVLPAADCRAYLSYSSDARDFDRHLSEFVDVVEHARAASGGTFLPPFPPGYLVLAGLLVDAVVTMAAATTPAPPDPEPDEEPAIPERPRRRRRSRTRNADARPLPDDAS